MVGGWWLVVGGWWLVVGCWWLAVGSWWLVVGGWWLAATTESFIGVGVDDPVRRPRRSAAKRREQRLRADARFATRLLRLGALPPHRGFQTGVALAQWLPAVAAVVVPPSAVEIVDGLQVQLQSALGQAMEAVAALRRSAEAGREDAPSPSRPDAPAVALVQAFRVLQRARVRASPEPAATTQSFLESGHVVRGVRVGRWLRLVGDGYVLVAFEDGEPLLEELAEIPVEGDLDAFIHGGAGLHDPSD